jgi:hypothetical protein
VLDDQVAGIETLGVGVGLSVLEETEEELGRLDGPAGLGDTERLACVLLLAAILALRGASKFSIVPIIQTQLLISRLSPSQSHKH